MNQKLGLPIMPRELPKLELKEKKLNVPPSPLPNANYIGQNDRDYQTNLLKKQLMFIDQNRFNPDFIGRN